jgi:hypothetical protein
MRIMHEIVFESDLFFMPVANVGPRSLDFRAS